MWRTKEESGRKRGWWLRGGGVGTRGGGLGEVGGPRAARRREPAVCCVSVVSNPLQLSTEAIRGYPRAFRNCTVPSEAIWVPLNLSRTSSCFRTCGDDDDNGRAMHHICVCVSVIFPTAVNAQVEEQL